MSVGSSGRIVLEIDPVIKKQVYQALKSEGLNMKDWFLQQAEELLNKDQLTLSLGQPEKRTN